MTRLAWNGAGERYYEVGVDRGVLYVDAVGVPWNGLVSIEETPSGGEVRSYYLDGNKYVQVPGREEFEATIAAFYSPPEFDACEGIRQIEPGLSATQQRRKAFGLCYRTRIGNDLSAERGYKLHIVYNAMTAPSSKLHETISDNPAAPLLRWFITTKTRPVAGKAPTAHLIVDSLTAPPESLATLEDLLYGSDENDPTLPSPGEVISFFSFTDLAVVDLGDGVFTIFGPDTNVVDLGAGSYEVNHSGVVILDADRATVTSP